MKENKRAQKRLANLKFVLLIVLQLSDLTFKLTLDNSYYAIFNIYLFWIFWSVIDWSIPLTDQHEHEQAF